MSQVRISSLYPFYIDLFGVFLSVIDFGASCPGNFPAGFVVFRRGGYSMSESLIIPGSHPEGSFLAVYIPEDDFHPAVVLQSRDSKEFPLVQDALPIGLLPLKSEMVFLAVAMLPMVGFG